MKRYPKLFAMILLMLIFASSSQAQQDVYKGRSKAKSVRIAKKPAFPANIQVSDRSFKDSTGDGALDPEEQGKIIIVLENRSAYSGDVDVKITPLTPVDHLTFPAEIKVGIIKGNDKRTVEVPIQAGFDIASEKRELRIDVVENYYRFNAAPIRISFVTRKFEAPEFKIVLKDVKDERSARFPGNNNNGQIDKTETIEIVVGIQNIGGEADNVRAIIDLKGTETGNIFYRTVDGGVNPTFPLAGMGFGQDKDVRFLFFTNGFYNRETVDFDVRVTEHRGKYGKTQTFSLPVAGYIQTEDVLVVDAQTRQQQRFKELESGTIDIEDVPQTSRTRLKHGYAIIVGIEDYKWAPRAEWKVRDAQYFYEYANKVLGIPDDNILRPLFNQDASKAELEYVFAAKSSSAEGWLKRRIGDPEVAKNADVFVYLGGHGYPDLKTGEPYFIPYDVRPEQASNGIALNQLYTTLDEFHANSVTVFVESCFSGLTGYSKTREKNPEKLVKGINPIGWKVDATAKLKNTVVFAASSGLQASNNSDQYKHGIFTYYVLKGLKGEADLNKDKSISLGELWKYVSENVPRSTLRLLDRTQTPMILPGLDLLENQRERVLVKY